MAKAPRTTSTRAGKIEAKKSKSWWKQAFCVHVCGNSKNMPRNNKIRMERVRICPEIVQRRKIA